MGGRGPPWRVGNGAQTACEARLITPVAWWGCVPCAGGMRWRGLRTAPTAGTPAWRGRALGQGMCGCGTHISHLMRCWAVDA